MARLVADPARSPRGVAAVGRYREGPPALAPRPDGLRNLEVEVMRWAQLAEALNLCAVGAPRGDERPFAERALAFLREKRLA